MAKISCEQMIDIAIKSGCMVLENGGETYRTEETIIRVAKALGAKTASAFVTPTVIMFSYTDDDDHYHSATRRIKSSTVNLQKVARVNSLARKLERRNFTSSGKQVSFLLHHIEKSPVYSKLVTVVSAAFSSFCFALMFGGGIIEALFAFVYGIILRLVLFFLQRFPFNNFITSLISGALASFCAEMTAFLIPGLSSFIIMLSVLMQVVPGLAIVNGIRDLISGDLVSGTARIVDAFMIAAGLSTGAVPALMIFSRLVMGA